VVVDSDRERPLGGVLADHVLVEDIADLARLREVLQLEGRRRRQLLVDDLVAEIDALVADVDAGSGDQLLDLALRLAAEAAEELLVGVCRACQRSPLLGLVHRHASASSLEAPGLWVRSYSARRCDPAGGREIATQQAGNASGRLSAPQLPLPSLRKLPPGLRRATLPKSWLRSDPGSRWMPNLPLSVIRLSTSTTPSLR
jgi:hypothetical protein